jgi:EAL and modified HD-GYP domain-containing signal transduction protein
VETQQDYQQARSEGFTLFQGYFFCRPVLLKSQKIPPNSLFYIEILQMLQSSPIDLRRLSKLVKRDASLTYRLLRLVNSPVSAIRQQVDSIEAALVVVGEDTFRRIATLAITSELNASQPAEILRMSFVRGRFCELASGLCAKHPTEQYLLGMLSLLPAMLRMPMEELLPSLPLRDKVRDALSGKPIPERDLLCWLEAYERGDWVRCDSVAQSSGLNQSDLVRCYEEALVWAEAAQSSVPSRPA